MKKQIKILLVIAFFFVLSSCTMDPKQTVLDPKKEVTVYIQDLPRDTVTMSIDKNEIYIFDKNNVLIVKGEIFNKDFIATFVLILIGFIVLTIILTLILIE